MEFIVTWVDGTYSEETKQELAVDSKWGNIISANGLMRKIWDKIEDRIYNWYGHDDDVLVSTIPMTGGTISKFYVQFQYFQKFQFQYQYQKNL